jgi:hypothetical protein
MDLMLIGGMTKVAFLDMSLVAESPSCNARGEICPRD